MRVHQFPRPDRRYKVTGLIDENDNELPEVIVMAHSRTSAKLEAARSVGGYWTDDTDIELAEEEVMA